MRPDLQQRFHLTRLVDPRAADTLAEDARQGLFGAPKRLSSKHLYDEAGSRLFEEICTLPEYYPTRVETELLGSIAAGLIDRLRPASLVELGSGSSSKTRLLLDALARLGRPAEYLPVDVSESSLVESAAALLGRYAWLSVRALLADFERPLAALPRGDGVLVAFLGGTIGNLEPPQDLELLSRLAAATGPGSWLLLGMDRVKDPWRIAAAYDDARGVTARFNLNLLDVLNRRLGADFDARDFRHLAFYDRGREQVEMHLVARRRVAARLGALDLVARFAPGESVRTEVSRKFTPSTARALVEGAGWELEQSFEPPGGDFSLLLARARRRR